MQFSDEIHIFDESYHHVLVSRVITAEEGFPVSPITAMRWEDQMDSILKWYTAEDIEDGKVELSVDGKGTAPTPGQLFRNPYMAKVLRSLGTHGARRGFYGAFPGKAIVESIQKHGGLMTIEDLQNHTSSTFPSPISVNYHGFNLWEVPPNGQGIAGLIALEGLKSLEDHGSLEQTHITHESYHPQFSAEMLHAQIEMMRLGFGDARAFVCDPDFGERGSDKVGNNDAKKSSSEWLLDKDRVARRALEIFDKKKAVVHGTPGPTSCTVSFQVIDKEGNAMSFVNRWVRFFYLCIMPLLYICLVSDSANMHKNMPVTIWDLARVSHRHTADSRYKTGELVSR
jgi:gamma-glutamyltranspeptidase/glutathione hydrolase